MEGKVVALRQTVETFEWVYKLHEVSSNIAPYGQVKDLLKFMNMLASGHVRQIVLRLTSVFILQTYPSKSIGGFAY